MPEYDASGIEAVTFELDAAYFVPGAALPTLPDLGPAVDVACVRSGASEPPGTR